jgi:hypothetical protein
MNTLEILKAARQTLTDPNAWTREAFAKDAKGIRVQPDSAEAVCWCSAGALRKHDSVRNGTAINELGKTVFAIHGTYSIPTFNDARRTTHAEVLHVFDMTIVRLESESKDTLQAKEK